MLIENTPIKYEELCQLSIGSHATGISFSYVGLKLKLRIKKDQEDSIGIYLYVDIPTGWRDVDMSFTFGVLNENNNLCCKKSSQYNFRESASRGFPKFKRVSELARYKRADNTIIFAVNIENVKWEHNHIEQINLIYQHLHPNETNLLKRDIQSTISELERKNNDYQNKIEKLTYKVETLEKEISLVKCEKSVPSESKQETYDAKSYVSFILKNINKISLIDIQNIQEEINKLNIKLTEKSKELNSCSICLDNTINMIFVPCGHRTACESCSKKIKECCICKEPIEKKVKVF